MSVLVTGACGGLGKVLAQRLQRQAREQVWLTDIGAESSADFIACDLTDAGAIIALIRRVRPQRIFHLAGSFTDSYENDYQVNALSACRLCEALLSEKLDARLILVGSAAEYGIVLPQENPVREDQVLRPVSIYGLTKAVQTHFATYFAQRFAVNVVVARLFNLNGPGLSERLFIGRVERLIARYKRQEVESIELGNLESQRDYISIEDAVSQLLLIADQGQKGEIYHVASGHPVTMKDLLAEMLTSAGLDMSVVSQRKIVQEKTGYDIPVIYADMSKTNRLTRLQKEATP